MLSVILKSSFGFCHLHSTSSRGLGENSLPKDWFNKHLLGKDFKIRTEIEKKTPQNKQIEISCLIFLEYLVVGHTSMVFCLSGFFSSFDFFFFS